MKKDVASKEKKRLWKLMTEIYSLDDSQLSAAIRGIRKMSDKKAKQLADKLESLQKRMPKDLDLIDEAIKNAVKDLKKHNKNRK